MYFILYGLAEFNVMDFARTDLPSIFSIVHGNIKLLLENQNPFYTPNKALYNFHILWLSNFSSVV